MDDFGAGIGLIFFGALVAFAIATAIMPFVVLAINSKLGKMLAIQRMRFKSELRHGEADDSVIDLAVSLGLITKFDGDNIRKYRASKRD